MADSNITRRALASALRELMMETPFSRINIADICQRCDMNRKSFYYHFKDKYDLLNWIYDTQFEAIAKKRENAEAWELFADLVKHLHANREFYKRAMDVKGQNSFSDHFRELMRPVIACRLAEVAPGKDIGEVQVNFYTDGAIGAIERWLVDKDAVSPERLLEQVKMCFQYIAQK